eukprot:gene27534-33966_t
MLGKINIQIFEDLKDGEYEVKVNEAHRPIFVSGCSKATLLVRGKGAKMVVNDCNDIELVMECALFAGTLEFVRCSHVNVRLVTTVPTVTVDISEGVELSDNFTHLYTNRCKQVTVRQSSDEAVFKVLETEEQDSADVQFFTCHEGGRLVCERAIREGAGYPTTAKKKAEADARDEIFLKRVMETFGASSTSAPTNVLDQIPEQGPTEQAVEFAPMHLSGLWIGEAIPDEEFQHCVPTNPIKWSLTLSPSQGEVSAFGAGYFDDAADVPGQPVLFY